MSGWNEFKSSTDKLIEFYKTNIDDQNDHYHNHDEGNPRYSKHSFNDNRNNSNLRYYYKAEILSMLI